MPPLDELIRLVYFPPRQPTNWSLESLTSGETVRYFSYGRHALLAGLAITGIQKGDHILVPGFICRDLLAAIHAIGAIPVFYPVSRNLQVAIPPASLPIAQVALAVNYFGFPQDLTPFEEYCDRTGAILIEDNAHGLFSHDEIGRLLGTRGDIGIFSLRKTISLPNGAALLLKTHSTYLPPPQIPFLTGALPITFRIKRILRGFPLPIGTNLPKLLTEMGRHIRKFRTGQEIPPSPPDAEQRMPENANPCRELPDILAQVDPDSETRRRRELYLILDEKIRERGGAPVFAKLPIGTVPYVFPFRATGDSVEKIKHFLASVGLECHPWPDLPDAIEPTAPEHYKTVWMVGFLW